MGIVRGSCFGADPKRKATNVFFTHDLSRMVVVIMVAGHPCSDIKVTRRRREVHLLVLILRICRHPPNVSAKYSLKSSEEDTRSDGRTSASTSAEMSAGVSFRPVLGCPEARQPPEMQGLWAPTLPTSGMFYLDRRKRRPTHVDADLSCSEVNAHIQALQAFNLKRDVLRG